MSDTDRRHIAFPWAEQVLDRDVELVALRAEVAALRAEMARREEAAYEHGLGSAAEVHRQNKLLAQMVAALIDPTQRLNLRIAP